MKVLIIARYKANYPAHVAPFIREQAEALLTVGVQLEWYLIQGQYWQNYRSYLQKIKKCKPDIIHAHYGLTGFFANLQRIIPVVTTFHGSDINQSSTRWISIIAALLSSFSIFVSADLLARSRVKKNAMVIPCGVDTTVFQPIPQQLARQQLNLPSDKRFVLFAGSFDNEVKNPRLAIEATSGISNLRLIELKGYTRNEVALLMNAVDACLMTSHTEGSPQFIKEAMACNCPVISVKVGDVEERLAGAAGCYLTAYESSEITEIIENILNQNVRSAGRDKLYADQLDARSIANRLVSIYKSLL